MGKFCFCARARICIRRCVRSINSIMSAGGGVSNEIWNFRKFVFYISRKYNLTFTRLKPKKLLQFVLLHKEASKAFTLIAMTYV